MAQLDGSTADVGAQTDIPELMHIELVDTRKQPLQFVQIALPVGAKVIDAVNSAGLDPSSVNGEIGIFGRRCELSECLHDADRVEIYRPLVMDPMAARRARAQRRGKKKAEAKI